MPAAGAKPGHAHANDMAGVVRLYSPSRSVYPSHVRAWVAVTSREKETFVRARNPCLACESMCSCTPAYRTTAHDPIAALKPSPVQTMLILCLLHTRYENKSCASACTKPFRILIFVSAHHPPAGVAQTHEPDAGISHVTAWRQIAGRGHARARRWQEKGMGRGGRVGWGCEGVVGVYISFE